jgi:hypothetical protein
MTYIVAKLAGMVTCHHLMHMIRMRRVTINRSADSKNGVEMAEKWLNAH